MNNPNNIRPTFITPDGDKLLSGGFFCVLSEIEGLSDSYDDCDPVFSPNALFDDLDFIYDLSCDNNRTTVSVQDIDNTEQSSNLPIISKQLAETP